MTQTRDEKREANRLAAQRYRERNRDKIRARDRERAASDHGRALARANYTPEKGAKKHYMQKYGLTHDEAMEMKAGGCQICGSHANMHIDHDHKTGKVRGALCNNCNTGLGKLGDSAERLREALRYLEQHEHTN